MIFGSYPCCGAALAISMPEKTPRFMREVCQACGAAVWHLLSRIDPQSWIEPDFLLEYEIDEATRSIRAKSAPALARQ